MHRPIGFGTLHFQVDGEMIGRGGRGYHECEEYCQEITVNARHDLDSLRLEKDESKPVKSRLLSSTFREALARTHLQVRKNEKVLDDSGMMSYTQPQTWSLRKGRLWPNPRKT